ncbi:MAG: helix-turn-helix domain-containing protein [Verrucomicrobiota bacterium]
MTDSAIQINDAAIRLGISRRSLYRLIADGLLPKPFRERGKSRLLESDINAYLERIRSSRSQ